MQHGAAQRGGSFFETRDVFRIASRLGPLGRAYHNRVTHLSLASSRIAALYDIWILDLDIIRICVFDSTACLPLGTWKCWSYLESAVITLASDIPFLL